MVGAVTVTQSCVRIKKASSTVGLKRLEISVALRAGQAKADASSEGTQYRHANPYTPSVPAVFEANDTVWLTGT
jgi:hypothetical protein